MPAEDTYVAAGLPQKRYDVAPRVPVPPVTRMGEVVTVISNSLVREPISRLDQSRFRGSNALTRRDEGM